MYVLIFELMMLSFIYMKVIASHLAVLNFEFSPSPKFVLDYGASPKWFLYIYNSSNAI